MGESDGERDGKREGEREGERECRDGELSTTGWSSRKLGGLKSISYFRSPSSIASIATHNSHYYSMTIKYVIAQIISAIHYCEC